MKQISPLTRLLALIYKEFVVILMDKGSRKILILPIIIQSILFGYGATFNLESVPYILYQDSFDPDATALVQRINHNGTFNLTKYCTSEQCF
ncbi:MAG: ABC transporter permease, partial [Anaerobiospirillum sp.]|nr:ABC transporter permease [Anaerobiospirillum sp.]